MSKIQYLTEKTPMPFAPGWSRKVEVNGAVYFVGVRGVKQVRIPYKPRGENRGWVHEGFVNDANGRCLFSEKVPGSLGARGLLLDAGIITKAD
jgi:hypothetical protein